MQLEHYFDIQSPTDIRLAGTRVGIETILLDYLDLGLSPEEIATRYPVLTLEQVFATLTYYWRNQSDVDAYLANWKAHGDAMRRQQNIHLPASIQRLRGLVKQQSSAAFKVPILT